jgi:hypothetical protein
MAFSEDISRYFLVIQKLGDPETFAPPPLQELLH